MLLTKEELDQSATIHPQIKEFLAAAQIPPSSEDKATFATNIKTQLKALSASIVGALGAPPEGTVEFYKELPMRDGFNSSIKIHRPKQGGGPLIVLLFGGGFIGGDNDQLSREARALVKLFDATVVNINYRLGPEDKWPAAQNDSWDSMKWLASNAGGEDLKADPSKGFLVGGVSAGSTIAAVLSRKFQEDPIAYPLTGQWLCIPAAMMPHSAPEKYKSYHISRTQNAEAPALTTKDINTMLEIGQIDTESDMALAVHAKEPIEGQPKTYFQVAGMDPLRDDGLIYHEMLTQAGVPTKMDFYEGCHHGFHMMVPHLEIGRKGCLDTIVGFGWLLGKDFTREDAAAAMGMA